MQFLKRAYAYVRVSTGEQVHNFSLDSQEKAIRDFCERNAIELVSVFREEGESAKTANRTVLRELRKKCQNARQDNIQHVIIFKIDRLSRDLEDFLMITREFKASGVTLLSPNEAFDLSATGKLNTYMLAAFAQFDNDVRSERTVTGMREGLTRGRWMWTAPVGYQSGVDSDGPSLIQNKIMAPLVLLGFERVASGESKDNVLRELTTLGLRHRNGNNVSRQTFNAMLKNPLYAGRVASPKFGIDCPGDFEAILPVELFHAVQKKKKGQSDDPKRSLDRPEFPFRRWLQCGSCLTPLTGSFSSGNGGRYGYYHCRNKNCRHVNVRKEVIETLFIEHLEREKVTHEMLSLFEEIVRDLWREQNKQRLALETTLDQSIVNLKRRRQQLLDLYIEGRGISEEAFRQRDALFANELDELTALRSDSKDLDSDIEPILKFAKGLLSDLTGCWNQTKPQYRSRFLRAMMPNGATYSEGTIRTTQSSWFITGFVTSSPTNNGLVPPISFSWNLLVSWLTEMEQLRILLNDVVKTA